MIIIWLPMVHLLVVGEFPHQLALVAMDIKDTISVLSPLQCLYQAWMHSVKYIWQPKHWMLLTLMNLFVTDALSNTLPPNPAETN